MAKEYKTLVYKDTASGKEEMSDDLDRLAQSGWELKSKEVSSQGWSFGKTCCLGCVFLPLALLGKKGNEIHIIMERESGDEGD